MLHATTTSTTNQTGSPLHRQVKFKKVQMYRIFRYLIVLRLLCVSIIFVSVTVDAKKPSEDSNNNDLEAEYLYHTEEANGIVIDYEPPPSVFNKDGDAKDDPSLYRPDFLYGPNQGPRVVEFYAPWCPHVRYVMVMFLSHCLCFRTNRSLITFINWCCCL